MVMIWVQIDVERALYVARGRDVILCDCLPSPVTLLIQLSNEELKKLVSSVSKPNS